MQKDSLQLKQQVKQLKEKIVQFTETPQKRKPKQTKEWNKIGSERTKKQRLGIFKELLINTIKSMKVCHRAEIYLWLEDNRIHFSFSPVDLLQKEKFNHIHSENQVNFSLDHTYCAQDTHIGENDNFTDLNYSEIYDSSANWQKSHIRRIIYVMDCFQISHEAYHELRMVSKGHLPPIGRLSKEKKVMSEEIPYHKHPKVNICHNFPIKSFTFVAYKYL